MDRSIQADAGSALFRYRGAQAGLFHDQYSLAATDRVRLQRGARCTRKECAFVSRSLPEEILHRRTAAPAGEADGMMRSCACLLFAVPAILAAQVTNWPQFRGPNGSGIAATEAAPPVEFKGALWKQPFPIGHSSPVVWGDRM